MKIQVFPLMYKGQKRIGIRPLGFDQSFPTLMKKIPGNRWTPNEKCWHIPYQQEAYAQLKRLFGEGQVLILQKSPQANPKKRDITQKIDYSKLIHKDEIIRLEERLRLQRYSYSTIKTYKNFFIQFLTFYPDRDPKELKKEDIMRFLLESTEKKRW